MISDLFERTRRPLSIPMPPPDILATLPGAGLTLDFEMETQQESQWCWSAVSVSVLRFYQSSSALTQCGLANLEFGTDVCCANPSACNVDHTLDTALAQVGHLNDMVFAPLSFQETDNEINSRRPLGCRIGWFGGGGHFVVIHGTSIDAGGGSQKMWVAVADPKFGPSDYLMDDFTFRYRQGEGEWTHSYLTQ